MSEVSWADKWPAKGLLAECRKLWKEREELRAEIRRLEAVIAEGPTWVTQSGVQWRLGGPLTEAERKRAAEIK